MSARQNVCDLEGRNDVKGKFVVLPHLSHSSASQVAKLQESTALHHHFVVVHQEVIKLMSHLS